MHPPMIDPRGHHLLPYDHHRTMVCNFEAITGIEVLVRLDRNGSRKARFSDRRAETNVLKMMQRVEATLSPPKRRA